MLYIFLVVIAASLTIEEQNLPSLNASYFRDLYINKITSIKFSKASQM